MTGSEALVSLLAQAGVEVIFGLCGDTSLPFYEAMRQDNKGMTHIITRDERSASYMAEAYARLTGRVGVCEGPSGGGVTYIAPGLAEADLSSVPVLGITSDIDIRQRGRGTLTELDQDAFFAPITTWTKTPSHSEELPWTVREAFRLATTGAMGATHLGLALNVQEGQVPEADVHLDARYGRYPADRPGPDPEAVAEAADKLYNAQRPVIIAGAGVIRSAAWDEVTALAELIGCPVATSISGKGAIAETHPLALGVIGSNGGLDYRHKVVQEADLIFYVGCRAGSVTTVKWTLPAVDGPEIIQLDIAGAHIGRSYKVATAMVADAKLGLAALSDALAAKTGGKSLERTDPAVLAAAREEALAARTEFDSDERPIRPERVMAALSKVLPDNAVLITDPGTPTPYLAAFYRLPRAGRWFIAPRAHGALGYALPAVIGGSFARPDSPILGFMGDGSFAISAGELETIARLNRPLTLVVFRNACYGWVKAGQRADGEKYYGVDFSTSNHAKIAAAYGIKSWTVEDPAQLEDTFKAALANSGPGLIEIVSQPLHEANAPVSKWVA